MTTTPTTTTSGAADLPEALINIAREIEALKRDCGMDTESAIAVQNGRYMAISYKVRALAAGQATAAQQGVAYAALPVPNYPKSGGFPGTFAEAQMRAFADATHTLRASRGQAPAGAGMGHTDGGRNMFYEGRFDGESQREQQARLRWANDMRAAFERHTGNGWFDKDWRTETGLWSSAWHACLAAQPTTTAQAADSVQEDAAREAIEKVLALFPFNVPIQKFTVNNGPCLTADNDDEFYSVKRVLAFLTEIKTTLDAARKQGGL